MVGRYAHNMVYDILWYNHKCMSLCAHVQVVLFKISSYLSQAGATPLWDTSRNGHTDVVDYLIRAGASINLATMVWRLHYTMQCIHCTLCMMQSLMS